MSATAPYRRFADMPELRHEIVALLESQGFTVPTPVQAATIPLFCGHKDVAVDALTGSGKTLAFVLPVVERLARLEEKLKKHQVGAIIVSPTRELSKQIFTVAEPFVAVVPGLVAQLLVGGTDPAEDVARLKAEGAHVLVGTPGRIDDVLKRCAGVLDLKAFEVLVLDEADRLLDMGFRVQLDAITARLPKQRRTGLFSATQTEAVQALARAGLRNPVRVKVTTALPPDTTRRSAAVGGDLVSNPGGAAAPAAADGEGQQQRTPSGLQIGYCLLTPEEKVPQFVHFLDQHRQHKVIVYMLTCACVDYWALVLRRLPQLKGLTVSALHGRMKQKQREEALQQYSSHADGVLLCTDVAARGLDIPDVHWILQADPPQDPAAFVHRVGRTARMGRSGNALVYLHPHEEPYAEFLRLRKVPLTAQEPTPGAPDNVLAFLRREAETDREVMEKGVHAFVSYVRAYKEHHCKFIFTLQDLDVGRLANSLGLLRLPKMPDVKRARLSTSAFVASEVDPDTVRFRDKARQKQRDQLLKARALEPQADKGAKGKPKAAAVPTVVQREREAAERLPAAKRRKLQERDEVAEMESDYRLLTKLKKGKISQRDYDVATGGEAASDDEVSSDDEEATTRTTTEADDEDVNGHGAGAARSNSGLGTSTSSKPAVGGGQRNRGKAEAKSGAASAKEAGRGSAGGNHGKKGAAAGAQGQAGGSAGGVGRAVGKRAHGGLVALRPGGALQTYVASQNRRLKRRSGKAGKGTHG